MRPSEPAPLSLVRPGVRHLDRSSAADERRGGSDDRIASFVELARMLLAVSSLSAHRAALVRRDLRLLQQEERRDGARPAVSEALMATVVDELADGVSSFSLRSLVNRTRLPAEPEPA